MSFASVWAKSQDSTFRQRLMVAVIEQCRWTLQIEQEDWPGEGISSERYAAMQDLARLLRSQVQMPTQLTQIGVYVLMPDLQPEHPDYINVDDDAALQTKVAGVFDELSGVALPP